jgi:GWxTD domain-containing protein
MKKLLLISLLLICLLPLPAKRKERTAQVESNVRIFSDLKKEYKLVSYFLSYQQKKYYNSLNNKNKSAYLETFWSAYNPNPISSNNEFLVLIRERIAYCNNHFSHFSDGWETDRGRIYIRNGEPFEIVKGNTSVQTKLTVKEYQIWKYRMEYFRTYIFFDHQGHGDFRIIYSDGDEKEMTVSDWLELLGPEFDLLDLQ